MDDLPVHLERHIVGSSIKDRIEWFIYITLEHKQRTILTNTMITSMHT